MNFEELYPLTITEIWIASCSASSEYEPHQRTCKAAFDGIESNGWAVNNLENIGAWIRINLDGVYRLTKLMVMSYQCDRDQHFKDISIEFWYGEPVYFTLDDTNEWQTIDLEGLRKDTNYVNISSISVYQDSNDGFAELKVFGRYLDSGMDNNVNLTITLLFYLTLEV